MALAAGESCAIAGPQAHYLSRVLRLRPGDPVRVFNVRDGEFDAELGEVRKDGGALQLSQRVRAPQPSPDIWLIFAPLKRDATDLVVEKATELGVRRIVPVLTERCDVQTVRIDRLERIAIEAAEQTERLDIPKIVEPAKLGALLSRWDGSRTVYFCDEAGDDGAKPWGGALGRAEPALAVFSRGAGAPAAVFVGPEGGFSPAERALLRALPYVSPIGLGPRILRAETAVISTLSLWQAAQGDWR